MIDKTKQNVKWEDRKLTLRQTLMRFLIRRKVFEVDINLFIARLKISLPSDHDWFDFSFTALFLLHVGGFFAYGCGWSISVTPEKTKYGDFSITLRIHANRIIFYLSIGTSAHQLLMIKSDWVTSGMSFSQLNHMREIFKELNISDHNYTSLTKIPRKQLLLFKEMVDGLIKSKTN